MTTAWGQVLPEETPGQHGDFGYYIFAAVAGALSGWVDIKVSDLLLTALVVLATSMLLGIFRPARPWRWVAIVGIMVPVADLLGYLLLAQKPFRAQIYESFLAFLPAIAGAYGGAMMRGAIRNISGGK
jgi:hypothetical protein